VSAVNESRNLLSWDILHIGFIYLYKACLNVNGMTTVYKANKNCFLNIDSFNLITKLNSVIELSRYLHLETSLV